METLHRSAVALRLNIGTSPVTGGMLTRSVSLPNVVQSATAAKILLVVGALVSILIYPLVRTERTIVTRLEN